MKGFEALGIVSDLASQQWGLVTSTQAKTAGIDLPTLRRLAQRGGLIRVRHGVYASAATAMTAELDVKAQWLALRPELMAVDRVADLDPTEDAVVSHTTAADMWGIGDLWPDGIHFTVGSRRQSRQSDVAFHRAALSEREWVVHPGSGLPVTSVLRTIVDVARSGYEPGHLLGLIDDAARKHMVDEWDLLDAFTGWEDALGVGRGGRRALRDLLDEYFPSDPVTRQAAAAVDEMLRPVRAKLDAFMDST